MRDKRKSNFRDKVVGDAKRQQTSGASYGYLNLPKGVNVFSPDPDSRVRLDFLPYEVSDPRHPDRNPEDDRAEVGTLWYKRPFKIHRNIGVDNDSIVCLTSVGKKCPICEYRQKRLHEGAPKEETDKLKASLRNLYVVVPIGQKDYEEKPHIFDMSQWLFQKLLNEELDDNPENGIFPSLEEGLTLRVRFGSGTVGKSQPFAEADRIDFLEREEQYTEEILKDVPDLDKVLQITEYSELQAKFFEMEGEEDAGRLKNKDDDEDDSPVPVRRKPKDAPKEDDEDDEPVRRKPKTAPKKEEEEEDEPAPARTRTRVREEKREEKEEKNACPYKHKFGVDFDQYPDDCDICDKWDDCMDENKRR